MLQVVLSGIAALVLADTVVPDPGLDLWKVLANTGVIGLLGLMIGYTLPRIMQTQKDSSDKLNGGMAEITKELGQVKEEMAKMNEILRSLASIHK